jgi:hypothetical protein
MDQDISNGGSTPSRKKVKSKQASKQTNKNQAYKIKKTNKQKQYLSVTLN